jgi:hypothetical protein
MNLLEFTADKNKIIPEFDFFKWRSKQSTYPHMANSYFVSVLEHMTAEYGSISSFSLFPFGEILSSLTQTSIQLYLQLSDMSYAFSLSHFVQDFAHRSQTALCKIAVHVRRTRYMVKQSTMLALPPPRVNSKPLMRRQFARNA